jgi:hypothetical protein
MRKTAFGLVITGMGRATAGKSVRERTEQGGKERQATGKRLQ